jgi:hypothetical protein
MTTDDNTSPRQTSCVAVAASPVQADRDAHRRLVLTIALAR